MSAERKLLKRQKLRNNEYYDLQQTFDDLYTKSQSYKVFKNLVEIIARKENILLAYRNIKNNTGSRTEGTDGRTIEYLASFETEELVSKVRRKLENYFPQSVRRVMIPKHDGKTRPLGIPTIMDRLIQQCVLQVLDPICEAKFHKHSYGFRPLRSTKHALARAYHLAQKNKLHYVVDIDIKGFFDNINHGKLLKQLWSLGIHDKSLIKIVSKMLKAEIEGEGIPQRGTPQGGILSPLLANVALNELDWWVSSQWETMKTKHKYAIRKNSNYAMYQSLKSFSKLKEVFIVRYADDFKIFCRNHNHAERIFAAVQMWLKERLDLEISLDKSKITNLRKGYSDFLGVKMKLTEKGSSKTADGRVRSQLVIKSHIADKAKETILTNIELKTKEIQHAVNDSGPALVYRFTAYIMGIHNYYNCATHCSIDFADIAFRSRAILKNRLKPRRKRENEKLPAYVERYYGKSKQLRFVYDVPLIPLAFIRHETCLNYNGITQYSQAGRNAIHNTQRAVPLSNLRYLLANPVQKKSVEYNDNRLSRYVGQYGRCAVSGVELAIGDIHCHHIIPLGMGGTDEYSNLVIVSNDVHKLLHAKTPEVISYYSRLTNLNEAKFKKLNTLREKANLFPIL